METDKHEKSVPVAVLDSENTYLTGDYLELISPGDLVFVQFFPYADNLKEYNGKLIEADITVFPIFWFISISPTFGLYVPFNIILSFDVTESSLSLMHWVNPRFINWIPDKRLWWNWGTHITFLSFSWPIVTSPIPFSLTTSLEAVLTRPLYGLCFSGLSLKYDVGVHPVSK